MSRFARQVDANQALIAKGLRLAGASVSSTANVAGGFGDLCVGVGGANFLLEVKNPNQDRCKRKLRPLQTQWAAAWKGQRATVETLVQALQVCGLTLPDEKLIQLALEKAKGVVDGAGWVRAAAWGSRAVGIALPFAPLPSPAKPQKSGGPFRRKGKGGVSGSAPVAPENSDVGQTPTCSHQEPCACPLAEVANAFERKMQNEVSEQSAGPISMDSLLLHELDEQEAEIARKRLPTSGGGR